jgi:hypothetical protein
MNDPIIREVKLKEDYPFQYENFVLATQHELYLLIGKETTAVSALRFRFSSFKYGSPNDEARGSHPLMKYGLGLYGLYQIENSPWINELMVANRVHPSHKDSMFADRKHYIACFKDVMLEVVCRELEEVKLEGGDLVAILQEQIGYLE